MWSTLNFHALITVAKHMVCSLHLIPEVRQLTRVSILYYMLYMGFIFIRVGFSVEINQSRFRNALLYGKRILADRGFRIKGSTEKTGILISICFSLPT